MKNQRIKKAKEKTTIEVIKPNGDKLSYLTKGQEKWFNEKQMQEQYTIPKNYPGFINIRMEEIFGKE